MSTYLAFRPPVRIQTTLALSPDASRVAYADDKGGQFNVAVRDMAGSQSRSLTHYTDHTVRRVAWHPNGEQLLFVADRRGNENSQLYLVPAGGGAATALTSADNAQHFAAIGNPFSPDGRLVAYAATDRKPDDQDILLCELETGVVRRIFAPGGRLHAGYWSADGARLSITEWVDETRDHIVHVADLRNGKVRRITFNLKPAVYWLGPWLPDGSGFIVRTNLDRDFEALAVVDADSGELTFIDAPNWDVEQADSSADGRILVWTVDVDGASQMRARDMLSGETIAVPELPLGVASRLSLSADGAVAVLVMATPKMPNNVLRVDLKTGELTWITEFIPEGVVDGSLPEPELVRFTSPLGDRVPAYVYLPREVSRPLGVVISIHGGPTVQERPNYPYGGMYQFLQDQGIAVFAPNIHGSSGYGYRYQSKIYRNWGGDDLNDIDAAVGYLLEQPWVDPDRIALFGGSYGGFVALSALSRLPHRRFAGAVVYFGPSNLVTLAKASPPTWRSLVERIIGNPETDFDFLMSRSPVTYSDAICTPLLLLQGANDPRVPQSESDQIVDRLAARGVDVDYRVFDDEGHGFTKTENEIAARTATTDFFVKHVGTATGNLRPLE